MPTKPPDRKKQARIIKKLELSLEILDLQKQIWGKRAKAKHMRIQEVNQQLRQVRGG